MPGHVRHPARPWAAATSLLVALLAAGACTTADAATTAWTRGPCTAGDGGGVTVVVDFGALDGNGGRPAATSIRCVQVGTARMTGIEALRAAGFRVAGVDRFDSGTDVSFACRIDGRPTASEPLPVPGAEPHRERCTDTPPTSAHWSYWTAPRLGAAWTYSTLGADARFVRVGAVEGWSFSIGASGTNPTPPERVAATAPAAPLEVAPEPAPAPAPAPVPVPVQPAAQEPFETSPFMSPSPSPSPMDSPFVDSQPGTAVDDGTANPYAIGAASWLASSVDADGGVPGPDGESGDAGLAMDVLFALRAVATDEDPAARIHDALARDAETIADDPALLAKLLVATVVAGRAVDDVGSLDVRSATLEAVETGADPDLGTFGRAYAVLGLARSGGAPTPLVDQLLRSQCPSGWFRVDDAAPCSAASVDPDATSVAVQALVAARITDRASVPGTSITRALDRLAAAQRADGSVGGGVGTRASNANSTGLAAQAFDAGLSATAGARRARYRAARTRAGSWMQSLVAGPDSDTLAGAIAYDSAALETVRSDPDQLTDGQHDQWRRATAQAVFAFAPVSLHRLGGTPLPQPSTAQRADGDPIAADASASSEPAGGPARDASPRTWLMTAFAVFVGALLGSALLRRLRSIESGGDR